MVSITYALPAATASKRGGIEVGSGLSISGDVLSATGSAATPSTILQLDFTETTDLLNGVAIGASWTDICANKDFSVSNATSIVEISVSGLIQGTGASQLWASRLVIDSAGTPINKNIGGCISSNQGENVLSGVGLIPITGLSVGTHTIKVQLKAVNGNAYCTVASNDQYSFMIKILERVPA